MKNKFSQWLLGAAFTLLAALPLSAQKTGVQPEKMPEYPGGFESLIKYMGANIKYPEAAKKANAEGSIIVKFTIEADGSVSGIHTENEGTTQRPDMVMEAIRVVKGMPKWAPAQKQGKAVKCEMVLPVNFKLDKP